MLHFILISACAYFLTIGSTLRDSPSPTVEHVREILRGFERADKVDKRLIEFGPRAFPAYEAIIADPKSESREIVLLFGAVGDIKADRKQFLDLAAARLNDSSSNVRRAALLLLNEIGSDRDTSPIVALLSDEDKLVRRTAAKTLSRIGGKRDLVAMDIWLKTGNYQGEVQHLQHVKDCRSALEKRLKADPNEMKK